MADQNGFTLIELVIVIVILGILAVVAIPNFVNLSQDAQVAATNSIAGGLSSANAENYAVRIAKSTNGKAVSNCTAVASLLMSSLPAGYTITAASISVKANVSCTLIGPSSTSAIFTGTGIN